MSTYDYNPFSYAIAPLPWRKQTPLARQLGSRVVRFVYPGGAGAPLAAAPMLLTGQYGAALGLDRIIGMTLAIKQSATPFNFVMQEQLTGWQFCYGYQGLRGATIKTNIETFPDQFSLSFYFDAQPAGDIYLSMFNFELVPFVVQ